MWFKRDLRLTDHQPLKDAIATGTPALLLYIFEPSLLNDPHYSERHWRFVWQSLQDMNEKLGRHCVQIIHGEAVDCLERLSQNYQIASLYSHQEIGIQKTFDRDKRVADWLANKGIGWKETPYGAVIRGATNREGWDKHWKQVMRSECANLI
ncbi:cryptochrome [Vibrio ishigakensis]|uniref:Cryptochrome n=1 Tax=Vibrio ishigakensis TaxID=1481914 RepID=A0A0B8PBI2_9VIBR|nr:cryptochrome [Vibrio ishigakensis]